ncbi:hypothetical protein HPB51_010612 [Rhipicephalus microplus]|uniref:Uncharacterized protein n=1 Tax=Rhipicephalus microplus TaxID=6941 RepID=A0A9J6EP28_RHIMP|nr:hypothetical protein HPB51_010612 [Rhipicephalus microplus]
MAVHQPHPGRRSRSVSFDDGKPRVIPTELDPDVDPVNLKTVVGRPPTPRPSRGDLTVTPPEEHGENSRPPSASSKTKPAGAQGRVGPEPGGTDGAPDAGVRRRGGHAEGERRVGRGARRRRRSHRGREGSRQAVGCRRAQQRGCSHQRGQRQLPHRVTGRERSRSRGAPPSPRSPGVTSRATARARASCARDAAR